MLLVPNPELGGDSNFRHKKRIKTVTYVLAMEFHIGSTVLHHQRIMLYIGTERNSYARERIKYTYTKWITPRGQQRECIREHKRENTVTVTEAR